jgi:hypothetical protein
MRKLIGISAVIALLSGMAAQAVTVQENTVFPDMDVIASQLVDESTAGIRDIANPIEAHMGQSFTLTNSATLRAITVKSHSDATWNSGDDVLELWIGADTDPNPTNFVAGATSLLTTVDVGGLSVTAGNYYTVNLDSDLVLPAGDYGYQFRWTSTGGSHQWFLRRANTGGDYEGGGLLFVQKTDGSAIDFPFDVTAGFANDMVFGLHTATVGTVPTFSADPEEISMQLIPPANQVTGSVAVAYTADSTMDISISISDESHPGSFSLLSTTPQTLTDPSPSNTVLEFEFDNTVSNLTAGTSATGLATIAWTVTGSGITNETIVPLTANTGFAPGEQNVFNPSVSNWNETANWSLARVPGASGADLAIVQGGRTVNVETNFTGLFPWITIIRSEAMLNIGADFKGSAEMLVGRDSGLWGFVNQTAGTVETALLKIGDAAELAPSNSVYTLSGGTLDMGTQGPTIYSTGVLNIDGGAVTIDQGPANLTVSGAGVIKLQSGSFNSVGTGATDVLTFNTSLEVSGGTLTLNGQNKFAGGLTVIGDEASISIHRFGTPSTTGEVVFEMGETGVSTIVGPSFATLSSYNLTVDGANYTGGSTTIDLLTAGNLTAGFSGVTVTNFAAGTTASVTQTTGIPGKITLTITVPGYAGWIGGYGLSGSPDADWDYDFDEDGFVNFYEYAFGGDPSEITSTPNTPISTSVEDGGTTYFEYVYARRIGTETELDYTAQFGTDLVYTNWSGAEVVELPVTGTIDADYESVTNRVDMTGKPVGFMQVTVEEL